MSDDTNVPKPEDGKDWSEADKKAYANEIANIKDGIDKNHPGGIIKRDDSVTDDTWNNKISKEGDSSHSADDDNYFLVDLNQAITALLRNDKVLADSHIDIWYDLPENDDKTPDGPTICLYLYDVKENTTMRHGQTGQRGYEIAKTGPTTHPGYFNVQCSYLIIFWDKTSQQIMPNNQNAIIASRIVTALLNTYHIDKIKEFSHFVDYEARFIHNSEQMNSISNFWQSLKQRPRLCLSYEVTVPILIPETGNSETFVGISTATADVYPHHAPLPKEADFESKPVESVTAIPEKKKKT